MSSRPATLSIGELRDDGRTDSLVVQNADLISQNQHLRQQIRLLRENTRLRAARLITDLVSWLDTSRENAAKQYTDRRDTYNLSDYESPDMTRQTAPVTISLDNSSRSTYGNQIKTKLEGDDILQEITTTIDPAETTTIHFDPTGKTGPCISKSPSTASGNKSGRMLSKTADDWDNTCPYLNSERSVKVQKGPQFQTVSGIYKHGNSWSRMNVTSAFKPPYTSTPRKSPGRQPQSNYSPMSALSQECPCEQILSAGRRSTSAKPKTPSPRFNLEPSFLPERKDDSRKGKRDKIEKRVLGEIAFQLDRRILSYIFVLPGAVNKTKRRFYGFTINSIPDLIRLESYDSDALTVDEKKKELLSQRYSEVLCSLGRYGYRLPDHADFSIRMVNKYGLLNVAPDKYPDVTLELNSEDCLRYLVDKHASPAERNSLLILLDCLVYLSRRDGRPFFMW